MNLLLPSFATGIVWLLPHSFDNLDERSFWLLFPPLQFQTYSETPRFLLHVYTSSCIYALLALLGRNVPLCSHLRLGFWWFSLLTEHMHKLKAFLQRTFLRKVRCNLSKPRKLLRKLGIKASKIYHSVPVTFDDDPLWRMCSFNKCCSYVPQRVQRLTIFFTFDNDPFCRMSSFNQVL